MILSDENVFKISDSLNKLKVNTLIITGKHKIDLNALKSSISFDEIIISSGVPLWKRKQLVEQCKELKINHIDIREDGGKIYKL